MIAVGTMTWAREANEAEARSMYSLARERGVVWFDSASSYSDGEAERILGRCLRDDPRRDEVLISTKGGYRGERLDAEIMGSLKRIGTDFVELYLHHHWAKHGTWDAAVQLDEVTLMRQARWIGLSNCLAWQAAAVHSSFGLRAIQILYSLAKRGAESELIPFAADSGVQVFAYSPIAAGALACRGQQRLKDDTRYAHRFSDCAIPLDFEAMCADLGQTPAQLAVAWCEAHPSGLVIPIIGARNATQLEELLARKEIDADQWRAVASLFPAPQHPTGRIEEEP